uniref:Phosphatidylcholine transfer protein n=1 Tax=Lygus hesperus TaxID=30085 RepID=A0A146LLQ9_LYGHE
MLSLARSSFASLSTNTLRVRSFSSWQRKCPKFFKSSSVCVVRNCRAQIEFVVAYRVRRGLQLLILYSRLGEHRTLWRCLQMFQRYFAHYSKAVAISLSAAVLKFNWAKERIKDDEMTSHIDDIDVCHRLKKESMDAENYPCSDAMPVNATLEESCWKPFVSMGNLTIWKKQTSESQSNTLCCYKVYGYFDDVKALSFLQAYLDLETRKTWDQHVLKLEIVESEPSSNSDLIYWVSKWPRLFSNRDYVYKRRFLVDSENQVIAVVSKSATHPDYPPSKNNWRVQQYWSYLVVKPYKTFKEQGVEFSLTYYDDPGSNLPGSMLIWATVHGMPTYFKHLHEQTLKIESSGGARLLDFKNIHRPPQVEVDPYEGYQTEEGELVVDVEDDSKKTEIPETPLAVNVPFPLPPPSDPNKQPLLPKELSHDELLRSWKEIKLKVKESVEKVAEEINEVTESVIKSSEEPVPSSGASSSDSAARNGANPTTEAASSGKVPVEGPSTNNNEAGMRRSQVPTERS